MKALDDIKELRRRFLQRCDRMDDQSILHLLTIESHEELAELRKLASNARLVNLIDEADHETP